jgi:hypothetical protein
VEVIQNFRTGTSGTFVTEPPELPDWNLENFLAGISRTSRLELLELLDWNLRNFRTGTSRTSSPELLELWEPNLKKKRLETPELPNLRDSRTSQPPNFPTSKTGNSKTSQPPNQNIQNFWTRTSVTFGPQPPELSDHNLQNFRTRTTGTSGTLDQNLLNFQIRTSRTSAPKPPELSNQNFWNGTSGTEPSDFSFQDKKNLRSRQASEFRRYRGTPIVCIPAKVDSHKLQSMYFHYPSTQLTVRRF